MATINSHGKMALLPQSQIATLPRELSMTYYFAVSLSVPDGGKHTSHLNMIL
jgi:hypothetical protein